MRRRATTLRRFVDRDLSRGGIARSGSWWFVIALLLACAPVPFVERWFDDRSPVALALALAPTLAWLGFVGWRAWRLCRAAAIRGDRAFDRSGRHLLSADYARSESATKARRQRRRPR